MCPGKGGGGADIGRTVLEDNHGWQGNERGSLYIQGGSSIMHKTAKK